MAINSNNPADSGDAECQSRQKQTTAEQHLFHLLKIGHPFGSPVIKGFIIEHNIRDYALELWNKRSELGLQAR
jgi:hypothetical protein